MSFASFIGKRGRRAAIKLNHDLGSLRMQKNYNAVGRVWVIRTFPIQKMIKRKMMYLKFSVDNKARFLFVYI